MLSQCTPRWRDMGAAVGGTNQIDYRGGAAGREEKTSPAPVPGPVSVFSRTEV